MKKIIFLALISIGFLAPILSIFSQESEIIIDNGKKLSKPYMRIKHFEEMRSFPTNELNSEKRHNAIKDMERSIYTANKKSLVQVQQPEWRSVGPFNIAGRVKSIVVHPTNPAIVYIGAAAGGIWKTTDSGISWTPIFDFENGIGFGSLCIDNNNPNIIYAATGEAVLNAAAYTYLSSGVYKSTDDGETWTSIGLTQAGAFSKFFVHPLNSNKLVGGVVGANHGFYYSTDAGSTWNKSENFAKNVSDVTFNPNDENEYYVGVIGGGVYYTSNSGETWEAKNIGLPASINRVSVQLAPSNPEILYCLLEEEGVGNIYKSTNKGANWTRSHRGAEEFFNGQGWYNNFIMVHPTNPNIVFAGGIDIWKTSTGGTTTSSWSNITNGYSGGYVHVDQHCGFFNPQNHNEIWIGNDGGVYKSKNLGESFSAMNTGLEITQFYGMDIDQTKINRIFGGTQDNGTLSNHINSDSWNKVNGGDGFRTVIDHTNPNVFYGEVYTGNSVYPFTRNVINGSYSVLTGGIYATDVSGIWDPPLIMHPLYNFILYHGRANLYYSLEYGQRWTLAIPGNGSKFTAMAASSKNEMIVYAGDISGNLYVTKNHFENYKNTSLNGLVARTITDIECSTINENTAFVTVSGYGTSHVFKTTNAGDRWESIGDKLPDVPVLSIAIHPEDEDWLFVGTDIGVFATFNGGGTWLPFGRKFPRTIVPDVKILNNSFTGNYILRAATHGRSILEIDIPNDIVTDFEITSPTGGEILTGTSNYNFSWYGYDLPVRVEVTYDDGLNWHLWADNVNDNSIQKEIPNKETFLNRIKVSSITNSSQVKISNSFTISNVKKGSVLQTSSFSHIPYGIALDGNGNLWSTSFQTSQLFRINKTTLRSEDYITIPGDSLFTDLTIDKKNNIIYTHKMNSSGETGTGGKIIMSDMNGNEIKRYDSPAKNYPIGLEIVDQDLIVCDRDGNPKYIYITEPGTGRVWTKYDNPFKEYLGPRSICYDGERFLYQASTHFSGSSGIIGTYIVKIDKNDYTQEVDRIPLVGRNGIINCRGIEYDPTDKNFWITDYGGNIYKISGFETTVDVEAQLKPEETGIELEIFPNPAEDFTNILIKSAKENTDIEIMVCDVLGNCLSKVKKQNVNLINGNSIFIETEKLSSGIYYVTLLENGIPVKSNILNVMK